MRGSSPRQKEQKGSSGFSVCPPASPRPLAEEGGSYTNSTSQSAQRVNPWRYSALHCGQYITTGEFTTRKNHSHKKRSRGLRRYTVRSTPLFSSACEIIRKCPQIVLFKYCIY